MCSIVEQAADRGGLVDQTKRCPMCGETILAIAVRCRYCQADLPRPFGGGPAVDAGAFAMPAVETTVGSTGEAVAPSLHGSEPLGEPLAGDFEQRFLEFAYTTDHVINAPSVAYALKIPIDQATENLEDLAARDVLLREVDSRGSVYFHLPGRHQARAASAAVGYAARGHQLATVPPPALSPFSPPMGELVGPTQAPPTEGTALAALLVNTLCLPGLGSIIGGRSSAGIGQLLLFLIGIPLCLVVVGAPMILSAWIWALITGIDVMNQAKQAQQRLEGGRTR